MSKLWEKLLFIFFLISPFFKGLYFEKDFTLALGFISLIFITMIFENKKIVIINKRHMLYGLGIIIISNLAYIGREFNTTLYLNGLSQLLLMYMIYIIGTQIVLDKDAIINIDIAIILSGIAMSFMVFIPECYRNGRFEGPFLYANSQAMYLLICFILLNSKEVTDKISTYTKYVLSIEKYKKLIGVITKLLLLAAIILTNSRIVIGLTVLYIIYLYMFSEKINKIQNKETIKKNIVLGILGMTLIMLVALFSIYKNEELKNRININVIMKDANLRFSYLEEANDIILDNPLGLGYEGYLENQEVKENKYRLRLVHNSIYQFGLNYGIFMIIMFLIISIEYFTLIIKNNTKFEYYNLIIILTFFHSLFDVTLSFLAISNMLIIMAVENYTKVLKKD